MPSILLIETATDVCSVAIARDENILAIRENHEPNVHSALLTVYVDEVLREAGLSPAMLSAVAVSIGPGSYTGLRIGLSAAKGLCFALDVPLISISTLQSLANGAKQLLNEKQEPETVIAALLDARRMEVYAGFYNERLEEIRAIQPDIIEAGIYDEILDHSKVYFCGNGIAKTQAVVQHPNAFFLEQVKPSARNMLLPALWKYADGQFEDVAYTEPVYLKEFYTHAPRKLL